MARVLVTIASRTQWLVCSESPVNICWIFYVHEKKKRLLCNLPPLQYSHFMERSTWFPGRSPWLSRREVRLSRLLASPFPHQFQWWCILDVKYLWRPKYAHPHWWAHLHATSFKTLPSIWAIESVVAATFRLVLRQLDTGQLAEICCFKSLCWFCSKWFCKTTKALCTGAVIGISNKEEGTQIHNPLKKWKC